MNSSSPLDYLNQGKFRDPFLVHSNMYIPRDWYTALELCLYLAVKNQTYTQAQNRIVSYFITDFEFRGTSGDTEERENLKEYLTYDLDLLGALRQGGLEQAIYGNSFLRIYYPFDRLLVDTRESYRLYSLSHFKGQEKYNYKTMTYTVPDPVNPGATVELPFIDRKVRDVSRIKLMFIQPTRMAVNMNFASGGCEYIYRFEEIFRSAVKSGTNLQQINETPRDMLKAIADESDFKFNQGAIFHFKTPFISGLSLSGWGIPNILLSYNSIHEMQTLKCINESIGMDFMVPFRLLCPTPISGGSENNDAASAMRLGPWMSQMTNLVKAHRQDPKSMKIAPFPVTYQELGGNGKMLAPTELLGYYKEEILDSAGVPVELFKGTLSVQQIPTAVRMFQSTFNHIPRTFTQCVRWVTSNILDYLEMDRIDVGLKLPSIADDLEQRHIYLQLAAGGEISRETAYSMFNIKDIKDEAIRRTREDGEIEKARQKIQAEIEREITLGSAGQVMDAAMQSGGGPGGGMPAGGGGGMPPGGSGVTLMDIESQGEEQAAQLLQMEIGERKKVLAQIKATNPTLHAVVMRKMEDMRNDAANQARKNPLG